MGRYDNLDTSSLTYGNSKQSGGGTTYVSLREKWTKEDAAKQTVVQDVSSISILPPEDLNQKESDRLSTKMSPGSIQKYATQRAEVFQEAAVEDSEALGRIAGEIGAFKESFIQADLNIDIGRLGYLESEGLATESDLVKLKELDTKLQASAQRSIDDPYIGKAVGNIVPFLIESAEKGGKGALIGATIFGTGTAIATALSPIPFDDIALPITVPAMAKFGAYVGGTMTSVENMRKIEQGHSFREMKKAGVDEDIARWMSRAYGVASGALEVVGFKLLRKLLPGGDQIARNAFGKAVKSVLKTRAVAAGSNIAQVSVGEATVEGSQELVGNVMEEFAKNINDALRGTDMRAIDALDFTQKALAGVPEVFGQTLVGMGVTAIPGTTVNFIIDSTGKIQAEYKAEADSEVAEETVPEPTPKEKLDAALEKGKEKAKKVIKKRDAKKPKVVEPEKEEEPKKSKTPKRYLETSIADKLKKGSAEGLAATTEEEILAEEKAIQERDETEEVKSIEKTPKKEQKEPSMADLKGEDKAVTDEEALAEEKAIEELGVENVDPMAEARKRLGVEAPPKKTPALTSLKTVQARNKETGEVKDVIDHTKITGKKTHSQKVRDEIRAAHAKAREDYPPDKWDHGYSGKEGFVPIEQITLDKMGDLTTIQDPEGATGIARGIAGAKDVAATKRKDAKANQKAIKEAGLAMKLRKGSPKRKYFDTLMGRLRGAAYNMSIDNPSDFDEIVGIATPEMLLEAQKDIPTENFSVSPHARNAFNKILSRDQGSREAGRKRLIKTIQAKEDKLSKTEQAESKSEEDTAATPWNADDARVTATTKALSDLRDIEGGIGTQQEQIEQATALVDVKYDVTNPEAARNEIDKRIEGLTGPELTIMQQVRLMVTGTIFKDEKRIVLSEITDPKERAAVEAALNKKRAKEVADTQAAIDEKLADQAEMVTEHIASGAKEVILPGKKTARGGGLVQKESAPKKLGGGINVPQPGGAAPEGRAFDPKLTTIVKNKAGNPWTSKNAAQARINALKNKDRTKYRYAKIKGLEWKDYKFPQMTESGRLQEGRFTKWVIEVRQPFTGRVVSDEPGTITKIKTRRPQFVKPAPKVDVESTLPEGRRLDSGKRAKFPERASDTDIMIALQDHKRGIKHKKDMKKKGKPLSPEYVPEPEPKNVVGTPKSKRAIKFQEDLYNRNQYAVNQAVESGRRERRVKERVKRATTLAEKQDALEAEADKILAEADKKSTSKTKIISTLKKGSAAALKTVKNQKGAVGDLNIREISVEEAKVKAKTHNKATPSVYEVYAGRSSRGELVKLPNNLGYRIYSPKKKSTVTKILGNEKGETAIIPDAVKQTEKTVKKAVAIAKAGKALVDKAYDLVDVEARWKRMKADATGLAVKTFHSIKALHEDIAAHTAKSIVKSVRAATKLKGDAFKELLADVVFGAEDPNVYDSWDADKKAQLGGAVGILRDYFDKALLDYKDAGIEGINYYENKIASLRKEMGKMKDINKMTDMNRTLAELERFQFVHLPKLLWFGTGHSSDVRTKREIESLRRRRGFDVLVEKRKRHAITLKSLVDKKIMEKKDIDPVGLLLNYGQMVGSDMAKVNLRDAGIADGFVSDAKTKPQSLRALSSQLVKLNEKMVNAKKEKVRNALKKKIVAKEKQIHTLEGLHKTDVARTWTHMPSQEHGVFKKLWIDTRLKDALDTTMAVDDRQGWYERQVSIVKMAQFYNPIFMPIYDIWQAGAMGGLARHPAQWMKAVGKAAFDVNTMSEMHKRAAQWGTFSKPFSNPVGNIDRQARELLKASRVNGILGGVLDSVTALGSEQLTLNAFKKENRTILGLPVGGLYNAAWNAAWTMDAVIRQGTFNYLVERGMSDKDAAQTAAKIHADYAGVPATTRKVLNKVIFTPTFAISMVKVQTAMVNEAVRFAMMRGQNKSQKQLALGALTTAATIFGMHLYMTSAGYEPDVWGRSYVKTVDTDSGPREIKVNLTTPLTKGLKYLNWVHEFGIKPFIGGNPARTEIMSDFMRTLSFEGTPLLRTVAGLLNNKKPNGDKIHLSMEDGPAKAAKIFKYVITDTLAFLDQGKQAFPRVTEEESDEMIKQLGWLFRATRRMQMTYVSSRLDKDRRFSAQINKLESEFQKDIQQMQKRDTFDKLIDKIEQNYVDRVDQLVRNYEDE